MRPLTRRTGAKLVGAVLLVALFVALTLLTQIGGLALLSGWLLIRAIGRPRGFALRAASVTGAAIAVYAILTVFVVPPLAALGGRVPLPCTASDTRHFAAASPVICGLNRNYVTPRLRDLLTRMATALDAERPGTRTLFLDANFPFLDGFPLLPHLSHDDGLKFDLAFFYKDAGGAYVPGGLRSPFGYWAFESPHPGEFDACPVARFPTLRWDMPMVRALLTDLSLDEERTRAALQWLFTEGPAHRLQRVFVEPHLARRLDISSALLGFQGCRAARHDDHIHIQIAPSG